MSEQVVSKKRKSADGSSAVLKKVKMAKSAEKPAPLKSALKKPGLETSVQVKATKPSNGAEPVTKVERKKIVNGETAKQTKKTFIDNDEDNEGGAELTPDQTAALLAGFSSSDEEEEGDSDSNESGVPVSSLPKAPTTGAIQKRVNQAISDQSDPETTPGVIYIGRIPHGFFEPQMHAYFSQFGTISHLRLARNKKTGASQHYAFIEFASAAVADIVAKTMDKYLLFGHLLQVRRVSREQVREGLFKGTGSGGRRKKKPAPRNRLEGRKLKLGATRDVWEKRVEMENQRREKKADKLMELGYVFDMPRVKDVREVPVRRKGGEGIEDGVSVDGGVKVLEDGKPASVEVVETVQTVQEEPGDEAVVAQITRKKRPASGKTQKKKTVKRVKT